MKKVYTAPEAEIEKFTVDTVITVSKDPGSGGIGDDGDTEF